MSFPEVSLRLISGVRKLRRTSFPWNVWIAVSLTLTFALGCLPSAQAQSTSFANGTNLIDLSTLQMNGSAMLSAPKQLFLTNGVTGQVSSVFTPTPIPFGPTGQLEIAFAYQAYGSTTSEPADGIALILQGAGPSYLGLSGSGMGFFNQVVPGIGVTADYFVNSITGSPANTLAVATASGVDIAQVQPTLPLYGGTGAAGVRFVWVSYSNATNQMQVYYSGIGFRPATPSISVILPQDISSLFGGQIYAGLSASTGSSDCIQSVFAFAVKVVN